jgi:CHASE2 domain-containing sensor protein
MRKKTQDIELRRRNEDMIKFWAQYILLLMIGFIGVSFLISPTHELKLGLAILSCLIVTFLCFVWFILYHKETSDIIHDQKLNK